MSAGRSSVDAGASRHVEAARQQAMLAALFAPDRANADHHAASAGLAGDACRVGQGLAAYRGNGLAIAERALQAAYPVTFELLGESAAAAATHLWRGQPPRSGDLADWGAGFGDWLAAQPSLNGFEHLADCARLEWAMHRAERAASVATDTHSLTLLQSVGADTLRLRLKPSVTVLTGAPGFYESRRERALVPAAASAEAVVVARPAFSAVVTPVSRDHAEWLMRADQGAAISCLLPDLPDTHSGEPADLYAMLATLISHDWLAAIETLPTGDAAATTSHTPEPS